jgi:pyridoxal/pyridoxine/pyridoxamine kinase
MTDTQLAEAPNEDQQKELLQQLINSFNPKDFMTPSQLEIAELSPEALNDEYALVQSKSNIRSRSQRDLIVSRWSYEQSKTVANEAPVKTTSKKKTADKVSAKA